jgi:hypothetical protein
LLKAPQFTGEPLRLAPKNLVKTIARNAPEHPAKLNYLVETLPCTLATISSATARGASS